jgi:hypothetical protein
MFERVEAYLIGSGQVAWRFPPAADMEERWVHSHRKAFAMPSSPIYPPATFLRYVRMLRRDIQAGSIGWTEARWPSVARRASE